MARGNPPPVPALNSSAAPLLGTRGVAASTASARIAVHETGGGASASPQTPSSDATATRNATASNSNSNGTPFLNATNMRAHDDAYAYAARGACGAGGGGTTPSPAPPLRSSSSSSYSSTDPHGGRGGTDQRQRGGGGRGRHGPSSLCSICPSASTRAPTPPPSPALGAPTPSTSLALGGWGPSFAEARVTIAGTHGQCGAGQPSATLRGEGMGRGYSSAALLPPANHHGGQTFNGLPLAKPVPYQHFAQQHEQQRELTPTPSSNEQQPRRQQHTPAPGSDCDSRRQQDRRQELPQQQQQQHQQRPRQKQEHSHLPPNSGWVPLSDRRGQQPTPLQPPSFKASRGVGTSKADGAAPVSIRVGMGASTQQLSRVTPRGAPPPGAVAAPLVVSAGGAEVCRHSHSSTDATCTTLCASPSVSLAEAGRSVLADRFRTQMCRNYLERRHTVGSSAANDIGHMCPRLPQTAASALAAEQALCPYESRCLFAHGEHQLRTAQQNIADGLTTEEAIVAFKQREREAMWRALMAERAAALQQHQQQQQHALPSSLSSYGPYDAGRR